MPELQFIAIAVISLRE